MKIADDKIKLSITFDEYESRLIREAARIICACHDEMDVRTKRKDYRRVIGWAVVSFCRAVILAGKIVFPVAADLRRESTIEQRERISGQMPSHGPGLNQNTRWN